VAISPMLCALETHTACSHSPRLTSCQSSASYSYLHPYIRAPTYIPTSVLLLTSLHPCSYLHPYIRAPTYIPTSVLLPLTSRGHKIENCTKLQEVYDIEVMILKKRGARFARIRSI
jgi:hypothetical protein